MVIAYGQLGTQTIAVSPDGMYAAIGGSEMVVPANVTDRLQRMQQTTFASTINIVDLRNHSVAQVIQAEARGPIAWSPDGARIALAGQLYAEMFDSQTGKRLVHDKIEKSGTMNVQFTPDGRYFIEIDLNGMGRGLGVKIWDNTRHKLLQEIPGDIGGIAISRDGKYLAVGTTGRTTIWQFKGAELSP